jgi:hypothetical protein
MGSDWYHSVWNGIKGVGKKLITPEKMTAIFIGIILVGLI